MYIDSCDGIEHHPQGLYFHESVPISTSFQLYETVVSREKNDADFIHDLFVQWFRDRINMYDEDVSLSDDSTRATTTKPVTLAKCHCKT